MQNLRWRSCYIQHLWRENLFKLSHIFQAGSGTQSKVRSLLYFNIKFENSISNAKYAFHFFCSTLFYRYHGFSYSCKCIQRCKENVQPICEINKETRNACKYCRYKACMTFGGMQRELVKKNQMMIWNDDSISMNYESTTIN